MNLIDYTYFEDICPIPISSPTSDVGLGQIAELNRIIAKVQKRVLIIILGVDLYNEFIAGLDEDDEDDIDPKWVAMKDELVDAEGKESPLRYFAFVEWKKYTRSISTLTGDITPEAQGQQTEADNLKTMQLYNEGVDLMEEFYEWMQEQTDYDWTDTGFLLRKMTRFGI